MADNRDIVERLCEEMHDRYEQAAIRHGWQTNLSCAVPWSGLPEANKATMREAVAPLAAEIERLRDRVARQSEQLGVSCPQE